MSLSPRMSTGTFYMRSAEVGAVVSPLGVMAAVGMVSPSLTALTLFVLFLCTGVVGMRTIRDEYLDRLWLNGLRTAFIWVVTATLWPWLIGLAVNFNADWHAVAHADLAHDDTMPERLAGTIAICAFFVGFHIRRLSNRPA